MNDDDAGIWGFHDGEPVPYDGVGDPSAALNAELAIGGTFGYGIGAPCPGCIICRSLERACGKHSTPMNHGACAVSTNACRCRAVEGEVIQ